LPGQALHVGFDTCDDRTELPVETDLSAADEPSLPTRQGEWIGTDRLRRGETGWKRAEIYRGRQRDRRGAAECSPGIHADIKAAPRKDRRGGI
ncbi:MAG: hypothetical protein WB663_10635, partial [Beijerinckiaceae bacterium]